VAVPQSVPFTSHCVVMPDARCASTRAPMAALVAAFGVQPHSWLAQQLQPTCFSSAMIAAVPSAGHCGRSPHASPTSSRSLHCPVHSVASQV